MRWQSFTEPDWWRAVGELLPEKAYTRARHMPLAGVLPNRYECVRGLHIGRAAVRVVVHAPGFKRTRSAFCYAFWAARLLSAKIVPPCLFHDPRLYDRSSHATWSGPLPTQLLQRHAQRTESLLRAQRIASGPAAVAVSGGAGDRDACDYSAEMVDAEAPQLLRVAVECTALDGSRLTTQSGALPAADNLWV